MRVADVPENHVTSRAFAFQRRAINRQHLAIALERHRVIGRQLHESGATNTRIDPLWQRVAFRFFCIYWILQIEPWSWFEKLKRTQVK